jgi:acetyltransferase-like isoleucine patch superfamily enzyme
MFKIAKKLLQKYRIYMANSSTVGEVFSELYGFKLGKNSRFTGKNISFGSEPFLIEIGDDVTITRGVKFQTHDGGVALFRKEHKGMNVFGKIKIGNNVFIGEDAMIMYGVSIGNNVVIGARSLVTKDIPDNSVAVGSPARVLKTLEEYKISSLKKSIQVYEKDIELRKKEIISKLNSK